MVNHRRMNFESILVDLEHDDGVELVMEEIFVGVYYLLKENFCWEIEHVDEREVLEMVKLFDVYEILLDLDEFLIMMDPLLLLLMIVKIWLVNVMIDVR
jgi:hypothetical protein